MCLQALQELQDICPQRCWERTHTASRWTYGHVVSWPDDLSGCLLDVVVICSLINLGLVCLCVCQVWSCTSYWWVTLPSGTRTNTNCTNKSRPVHMTWVSLLRVSVIVVLCNMKAGVVVGHTQNLYQCRFILCWDSAYKSRLLVKVEKERNCWYFL